MAARNQLPVCRRAAPSRGSLSGVRKLASALRAFESGGKPPHSKGTLRRPQVPQNRHRPPYLGSFVLGFSIRISPRSSVSPDLTVNSLRT